MRYRVFCLGIVLATSVWAAAYTPPPRDELTVDWIYRQTHQGKAYSIEALLGRFQPRSLERRLLAYHSESQQFATFESPRAVVYNYDADFIMTFNGEGPGLHDLEILEFDHQHAAFQPHVFHFDPEGKRPPEYEAHPTICATCHQTDIRPNWDPYFFWTGFYGSEDDDAFTTRDHTSERTHFADFLKRQQQESTQKRGRYRFLPAHPAKRLNLDFNDRVTCLNLKRMLRLFSASPDSGALWKYLNTVGPHQHEDPYANLPAEFAKRSHRTYAEVLTDTRQRIAHAIDGRLERFHRQTGDGPQGRAYNLQKGGSDRPARLSDHAQTAAFWRYAFEDVLGFEFDPIATSKHPDFDLNVDADSDLDRLLAGATVDEKTGRLVLSHELNERTADGKESEYYSCPRYGRYYDLPVWRDRE